MPYLIDPDVNGRYEITEHQFHQSQSQVHTWASTFKTKLRVQVQLQVSITPFEIKFGFTMHLPWTQPIFIPKATDRSFKGLS